ncbi:MAG: hypothetical protein ABIF01_02140 [Candidatus Micrarchaeota archaeon]
MEFPSDYRGGVAVPILVVSFISAAVLLFKSIPLAFVLALIAVLLVRKVINSEPNPDDTWRLGLDFSILSIASLAILPLKPIDGLAIVAFIPLFITVLCLGAALIKETNFKRGFALMLIALFSISVFVLLFSANFITCCGLSPPPQPLCLLQPGIACTSFYLYSENGKLNITLENQLGKPIMINGFACGGQFEQCTANSCEGFDPGLGGTFLSSGASKTFLLGCYKDGERLVFSRGSLLDSELEVGYYLQDEGPRSLRRVTGYVVAYADVFVKPGRQAPQAYKTYATMAWYGSLALLLFLIGYRFLKLKKKETFSF